MSKKVLITAALPYANGPLHFGHIAGAYLPSDCYARHQRLKKKDVLYICGSDEHGVAITLSADIAKRTPQEHVNIFHNMIKNLFHQFDLSFDHYSRTTWPGHIPTVQDFFMDLCDNGYIEEKIENHLYSKEEKRFLADRYVVGTCPECGYDNARGDECGKCGASYEAIDLKSPRSKLTNSSLMLKTSKHWYLRFDKFKEKLLDWVKEKNWKPNVMNFTLKYIEKLRARAITRDSEWGVSVPLASAKEKVFYVWFDAPIGYISATKEWAEKKQDPDLWKKYWMDAKTKLVQFLGKDNIPFHTVFFPAMIMGQNNLYKLPDEVPANEFYMLEGRQFSKSEGWYIDLEDFFSKFSSDQIRYYLAATAPETSDSEFTWKDFQTRANSELLGKFGNFVHRTMVFAKNNCDRKVPEIKNTQNIDEKFLEDIESLIDQIDVAYSQFHLKKASSLVMELAQLGNIYFDTKKPWALAKDPEKFSQMETTISLCLFCIKALALASLPIIPKTAQKIWELLGYSSKIDTHSWDEIKSSQLPIGQTLSTPEILFKKIEDEEIEKEEEKLYQNKKVSLEKDFSKIIEPEKEKIAFEDFEKIDLRVGRIVTAEKIPKSKKLLRLEVDMGTEVRQIVSGIAKHYAVEELIGKNVVVVINLKPIKLMNVESHGMILAGSDEKALHLPFLQELKPGSKIS